MALLGGFWLAGAALMLFVWYRLWRRYCARGFGMDPYRIQAVADRRSAPVWVLVMAQVALLCGVPLVNYTQAAVYGVGPMALWVLLGAMLLSALPTAALIWLPTRTKGLGAAAMLRGQLGERGVRAISLAAWLLCMLCLAVMLDTVAGSLDGIPARVMPGDYLADEERYNQVDALTSYRGEQPVDVMDYVDLPAFNAARETSEWEAARRGVTAGALVAVSLLALVFGQAVFRVRRSSLLAGVLVMALFIAYWAALAWQYPLRLTVGQWRRGLFVYAVVGMFVRPVTLSRPRDTLAGLLTLALALAATAGAWMGGVAVAPPLWLGTAAPGMPPMLPTLCTIGLAGGAGVLGFFSAAGRNTPQLTGEPQAARVGLGGALLAAWVGLVFVVALGSYSEPAAGGALLAPVPVRALADLAVQALEPALAALGLAQAGLAREWAAVWVMLVVALCAMSALDVAARLGCALLRGAFAGGWLSNKRFAPARLVCAGVTAGGAWLVTEYLNYDMIWPLFGAVSPGLCAALVLPAVAWLRRAGRAWRCLAVIAAALALLSLVSGGRMLWQMFTLWQSDELDWPDLAFCAAGVLCMLVGLVQVATCLRGEAGAKAD
ncbi:MAG: hypothetical protein LBU67_03910 [Oscillospiraceae bacterium]|jgi:carbon starvation protein CstA|nr:hypothetical protein [Oscillospiraceae bacterium]